MTKISEPIKVAFRTLGCRLNHSESDSIASRLQEVGYEIVPQNQPADITVINSCTVTQQAAAKTRGAVAAARRISPPGKIIVAGCYAQEIKAALLRVPGVDLVIGNQEKYQLEKYIPHLNEEPPRAYVADWNGEKPAEMNSTFPNHADIPDGFRTRAFMKIQDGCDYYCDYCIIPYLRGPSRSRPWQACLTEAQRLYEKGYQEIVLSGINLGHYQSTDNRNLADLIKKLIQDTDIPRIQLSSIEPDLVNNELIDLMKNEERICRHFHIPLQHGTYKILDAMGRKYTPGFYQRLVRHIAQEIPGVSIGTDVMVGYPGESSQDFNDLVTYLKVLPVNYLHVFRYSQRPLTRAVKKTDTVSVPEKKQRAAQLRKLSRDKQQNFIKRHLDNTFKVLYEEAVNGEYYQGYTDNYIKVKTESNLGIVNQIKLTKLYKIVGESSLGEIIGE